MKTRDQTGVASGEVQGCGFRLQTSVEWTFVDVLSDISSTF